MISKETTLPLLFIFPLLVVMVLLGILSAPTMAAPEGIITVDTLADDESDGCGTNNCTLREAIADAIAGNTVEFGVSGHIDISSNGQLTIDKDLIINGGNAITVSGGNATRVFKVIGGNVTFDSLTIINGDDQSTDCNFGSSCGGGLLIQNGSNTVTVTNSIFINNSAYSGGGLYNGSTGIVAIKGSVFDDNSATRGGGIYNDETSTTIISDSILSSNWAYTGGSIYNAKTIIISNNSIITGNSADSGGGIYNHGIGMVTIISSTLSHNTVEGNGGAISNASGTITISSSTISENSAIHYGSASGGGIYNYGIGKIIINNSTIASNLSDVSAIHNDNEGAVTISNSIIHENNSIAVRNEGVGTIQIYHSTLSNNSGYGIASSGMITINNSTISDNDSTAVTNSGIAIISNSTLSGNTGRGITNSSSGIVTLNNSTLSGNSVIHYYPGGAISNHGTMTISSSTITNNQAGVGGGISSDGSISVHTTLTNTIVSGNISNDTGMADDLALFGASTDSFISGGHNLIGTIDVNITAFVNSVNGDQTGINNPKINSLANNGGDTFTHALQFGSPAIDAGDDSSCPITDQRGVTRVGICDIGAYEYDIIFTDFVFLPVVVK